MMEHRSPGEPGKTKAGPSTPLKYASLRMTGLWFGKTKNESRSFDSAEVRFAQDDRSVFD
jgi:hypothetical protein